MPHFGAFSFGWYTVSMAITTKKHAKKRLVLLDAHAIIHRAYHALPEFSSSTGEPTGALYGVVTMLFKLIEDFHPDYIVACYDLPQKTFRHEAYTEYKAGRAKADDALKAQLASSRKIFEAFDIPIYDMPGFEADDMLGTIVSQLADDKDVEIIIASGDMDTLQLVSKKKVRVFTLRKGITDTVIYDEDAVVERFGFPPTLLPDYKGLRGDPSDNIIGIKGIGEKTATTLIATFGTVEKLYEAIHAHPEKIREAGISERILTLIKENEEEALFSKTLATIRRDAPIEFILPEKQFTEGVIFEKIDELFVALEFCSLRTKAKALFGPIVPEKEIVHASAKEIIETGIALWLLDSDRTNPTEEEILTYAKKDDFASAKEVIFADLKKDVKLQQVFDEIEKPLMPIIARMEERGIAINQPFFLSLSKEYHQLLDQKTKKIYELAGKEFNINSPKQLSEILFDTLGLKTKGKRGATGSFSTKVEVLEELFDVHAIIPVIMEYREMQKLLSTYIDVIPHMVGEDGKLHASFIQHGTTTGRFSSNNPNLQNIPIKTDLGKIIRNGFTASPGHTLIGFDYSQIELRVMALVSGDPYMVEVFKEGKDIHAGVASRVFGVTEDAVDHDMRRKAKVINFGIIYGMGVSALKKNLNTSREEAEQFYEQYFKEFAGVREYLDETKAFAMEHVYTETLFGRKRRFPNIRSRIPFIKTMAERTATNAPIQGTAADVIKLAIRFAEEDLVQAGIREQVHLLLQIHDELIYEVVEGFEEQATKIISVAMRGVFARSFLHLQSEVPLEVHFGSGNHWGELK
jgi:DNA polymerase-1